MLLFPFTIFRIGAALIFNTAVISDIDVFAKQMLKWNLDMPYRSRLQCHQTAIKTVESSEYHSQVE